MLAAIGDISSAMSEGTEAIAQDLMQLLNYAATHPDVTVQFIASNMQLHIHSNASYLSIIKARSRAAGIHYLSYKIPAAAPSPTDTPPPINGAIHIHCSIMSAVLALATEAETGALFHNGKDAAPIRVTLEELGHPQGPTPIQTKNACASGIVNDTVKHRRSKATDMRFYWIKDRVEQGQYTVHWRKGTDS
jgi:hypothetical protein